MASLTTTQLLLLTDTCQVKTWRDAAVAIGDNAARSDGSDMRTNFTAGTLARKAYELRWDKKIK